MNPVESPENATLPQQLLAITKQRAWLRERSVLLVIIASIVCIMAFAAYIVTAPKVHKESIIFRVAPGESVSTIATNLKKDSLVRSASLVKVIFAVTRTAGDIRSGDYIFEPGANMIDLVRALIRGDYGEAYTWVTIPEGSTNREIARIVDSKIPSISQQKFLNLAKEYEGYLFPDTYHISKLATEEEVIQRMRDTFMTKTRALQLQMGEKKFKEAIVIASLLEHEAVSVVDARVIAGIIQNRLRIDMRLQIDATLKYLTGRGSAQITRSDMALKSPYNTYRVKGLPPTPIGNPGFEMITAALYPEASKYIYYLHAPDRTPYYAVTHDEHVNNKNKYLK